MKNQLLLMLLQLIIIMTTFIPKTAHKILANPKLQREYFLKPYGLDIPKNKNYPKQHPPYKFFEHKVILHRPGKQVNDNVLVFKATQTISKPEIKQYLEKLYNINIEKVNSVRYCGVVKKNIVGAPMVTKPFKKFYVMTAHKIDPILNGDVTK